MTSALSVAILAGGNSTRMGQNKALISLQGMPLIQHVIQSANAVQPANITIVTNHPEHYTTFDHAKIADIYRGYGAISGIISALHHATTDYVCVIACDMPCIKPELIRLMQDQTRQTTYQAIIPTVAGYPQSVSAIYHRECLSHFKTAIHHDERKLKHVIENLSHVCYLDESYWKAIDPDGHSFINVNTPEDLRALEHVIGTNANSPHSP